MKELWSWGFSETNSGLEIGKEIWRELGLGLGFHLRGTEDEEEEKNERENGNWEFNCSTSDRGQVIFCSVWMKEVEWKENFLKFSLPFCLIGKRKENI